MCGNIFTWHRHTMMSQGRNRASWSSRTHGARALGGNWINHKLSFILGARGSDIECVCAASWSKLQPSFTEIWHRKSFGEHVVLLRPKYGENLDPRWSDPLSSSARPRLWEPDEGSSTWMSPNRYTSTNFHTAHIFTLLLNNRYKSEELAWLSWV